MIENEYGEVGIDHELVINADEEIFEMNNGCICCTVRGDLIRIVGNLMKRRNQFDHILIETTGLANPGPVIQTFFVDDEMKEKIALNAIVTLVDARHISLHLDSSDEALRQIAFADVILLNKTDLVTPGELDALEARIKSINTVAKIRRCQNADVPIDSVLNVGGFNLDHAIGRGTDIYRMKGVFAIKNNPNRLIFQGVHMLIDPQDGGPWGDKPRRNSLVFIGRGLDRDELNSSLRTCLA